MSFNILIIGAGQLGSRYLQGFVGSESELNITVVDPSRESLEIASARWIEAGGDGSSHQIRWMQLLPSDFDEIDIAFIITSSKGRADVVRNLADKTKVRYWVLEKVLAQSNSELVKICSSVTNSSGAWVNTPRRMMRWHAELKEIFTGNGPLNVTYSAGHWGLACNSIHFIDLVAWWSGEALVSVDTTALDHNWFESKRAGYFEITGELVAHFSDGTSLRLSSMEGAQAKPIRVALNDGVVWGVDESAGTAHSSNGERVLGRLEFQSQLSCSLVDEILQRGECDLPSLNESAPMHAIFLEAMLAHWNRSQNRNDDFVPIT